MKGKKNGAKGKSLSSLAAGMSTGNRPAPVNPLVAALARKGEPAKKRITAGLLSKTASAPFVAVARKVPAPFVAVKPPPPRSSREKSRDEAPQRPAPKPFVAMKPPEPRSSREKSRDEAPQRPAPMKPPEPRSSREKPRDEAPQRPAPKPFVAMKPRDEATPGARPESRPGPTAGIVAGLAGTSRTAASVAPLVRTVEASRAAPTKKNGFEHRRQYPRADLQVKAKLSLADDPSHNFEAALPTANLSVGGLFLASTFFLKMGTKLEVRLSLPPQGREVHVKAQVVRVDTTDEESSGFALRFTDYLDGSEVVLATHFLSPVLREFISGYAKGNGFKPTAEYLSHTADVLAAWELRRAALGGDVWVVPGEQR